MGQRIELIGQKAQLDVLRWDGRSSAVRVVRGPGGAGKSALLGQFAREARESGQIVLEVQCAHGQQPVWDAFRVLAILAAVRGSLKELGNDPEVIDSIDAVKRLCNPIAYASSWRRHILLSALSSLFVRIRARTTVVLLVDDADWMDHPLLALAAVHGAGHLVIASCSVSGTAAADLCAAAADVVLLEPLNDGEVEALARQITGAPIDPTVLRSLRESLGSLYGNPGTMVAVVADLLRRDRLVQVRGHLVVREPRTTLVLPAGHEMRTLVSLFAEPGRDLVLLAAGGFGFGLDDIPALASATERSALGYGQATDMLVSAGVLASGPSGVLTCPIPALVAGLVEESGGQVAVRELHRAVAQQLLDDDWRGVGWRVAVVNHLAAAGTAFPPRTDLVDLLLDDGIRELSDDPGQLVARRRAAWWHAGPGPVRDRLRAEICRLFVRAADYRGLAEFVDEVITVSQTLDTDEVEGLSRAAAFARLHLPAALPDRLRAAIEAGGAVPAPVELADRWLAGEPVDPFEIALSFTPDPSGGSGDSAGRVVAVGDGVVAEDVRSAWALRDLVPAFKAVFGAGYSVPAEGPIALYHTVLAAYADGDWDRALSSARQLELAASAADPVVLSAARLFSAEMCGWRGDDRQARGWLDAVPEDGAFPLLRAWVSAGLLYHAGDSGAACEQGWTAYRTWVSDQERSAQEPGAAQLLQRLATIAVEAGEQDVDRGEFAAAIASYGRYGPASQLETRLYVRGLLDRDVSAALSAERMIRTRGCRAGLVHAQLAVARVTDDPRQWLDRAYGTAKSIGAARLSAVVRRVMGNNGLVVPARRNRRPDMSDLEMRIIDLICEGRTNRQLASELQMSVKTVEKHLTKLFAKVGCRTRYGLVASTVGTGTGFAAS
ncbi:AAA family ATPase [Lentzea sp. NPDC059081]|uniref:helix-turn-helix transcriptional regulator n=1 Tax=Lentzea sp. NPDC059081 TaxID=3346719 RepID=UPI0036A2D3CF